MELVSANNKIKTVDALCLVHPNCPSKDEEFTAVLGAIGDAIQEKHPFVTGDALKNTRGSWYQWLLGASAWNWFNENDKSYLAVSLPKISSFDIADLYEERFKAFIQDLRMRVLKHAKVELVTSNPANFLK